MAGRGDSVPHSTAFGPRGRPVATVLANGTRSLSNRPKFARRRLVTERFGPPLNLRRIEHRKLGGDRRKLREVSRVEGQQVRHLMDLADRDQACIVYLLSHDAGGGHELLPRRIDVGGLGQQGERGFEDVRMAIRLTDSRTKPVDRYRARRLAGERLR